MMKICKWCGEEKALNLFFRHSKLKDGRRPECKECSKNSRKQREEKRPLETAIYSMAHGIVKRTILDVDKPNNEYYKRNGIQCRLGKTAAEVNKTLTIHYRDDFKKILRKGGKPSVDRIDAKGHYELGNIQIVTFEENMRRSNKLASARSVLVTYPDGVEVYFDSITEASRKLKCKRDTIYSGAKKPGTNRKGLLFKIG